MLNICDLPPANPVPKLTFVSSIISLVLQKSLELQQHYFRMRLHPQPFTRCFSSCNSSLKHWTSVSQMASITPQCNLCNTAASPEDLLLYPPGIVPRPPPLTKRGLSSISALSIVTHRSLNLGYHPLTRGCLLLNAGKFSWTTLEVES